LNHLSICIHGKEMYRLLKAWEHNGKH